MLIDLQGVSTRVVIGKACASPTTLVIAFRGSANAENWTQNRRIELVPVPSIIIPASKASNQLPKVHQGFLTTYQDIQKPLLEFLRSYLKEQKTPDIRRLIFTGHSLGGCLATLAAMEVRSQMELSSLDFQYQVQTFGAPRCGNHHWVQQVNRNIGNIRRQVEKEDAIALIPGRSLGYAHVGKEWFWNGNTMQRCDFQENEQCSLGSQSKKVQFEAHLQYQGSNWWGLTQCNSTAFPTLPGPSNPSPSQFTLGQFCESQLGAKSTDCE
jgi:predicted lipase